MVLMGKAKRQELWVRESQVGRREVGGRTSVDREAGRMTGRGDQSVSYVWTGWWAYRWANLGWDT